MVGVVDNGRWPLEGIAEVEEGFGDGDLAGDEGAEGLLLFFVFEDVG